MSSHDETQQRAWDAVDTYINAQVAPEDAALGAAQDRASAAGIPAIEVSPNQGKLLHLLARMHGARRILEVGTLAGYSTIWLARALPADGALVTLELDPGHAAVARENVDGAGVGARVEVLVGPALDQLAALEARGEAPFDLVFLDADKATTPEYLEWSLKLTASGSVIIADNVVRRGELANGETTDAGARGMRRLFDRLRELEAEGRVSSTAVQTVGAKGWDGFAVTLVS